MTRRHIHYEAAFEDYLRSKGIPYVPVDETRKVIFSGSKIKSFDFLVYPGDNRHWIVDVKGRQFPYKTRRGRGRYWENWVTQQDLEGLAEWQKVFGEDFESYFVFAYLLSGAPEHWPTGVPHRFREERYAFFSVTLTDYQAHCRVRSASWKTVSVARNAFREITQLVDFSRTDSE